MRAYTPDRWVVVEFTTPIEIFTKVFAGWYGGSTGGDSWKLNSGITNTRIDGDIYEFDGYSGSTYRCHSSGHGMSSYMLNLMCSWMKEIENMGDIKLRVLELDEIVAS